MCVLTHKARGCSPVVHPTENKVGKGRNCTSKPSIPRSHTAQGKTSWVNRLTVTGGGSLCCRSFFCQTRSRPSSPESLANAGLGLLGAHRDNAERQGAVKNHLKETLEGCSALMTQSQNNFGWKGPPETIQSNSTQAGSDPEQSPILTAGHFTASHAPDPVSNHLHRLLCVFLFWNVLCSVLDGVSCVSVCAHWLSSCIESSRLHLLPTLPPVSYWCALITQPRPFSSPGSTVPFWHNSLVLYQNSFIINKSLNWISSCWRKQDNLLIDTYFGDIA